MDVKLLVTLIVFMKKIYQIKCKNNFQDFFSIITETGFCNQSFSLWCVGY